MGESPNGEQIITVQDNLREIQLATVLNLKHMTGRWGHDAEDDYGNKYELKSTTKGSFGTGRDVSLKMIEIWRKRYWICATGNNLSSGFEFKEIYFLSPYMLEDWFNNVEQKIRKDLDLLNVVLSYVEDILTEIQLQRLEYLIKRGMTYNNPKIGLPYIKEKGIVLNSENKSEELKNLIKKYPLEC